MDVVFCDDKATENSPSFFKKVCNWVSSIFTSSKNTVNTTEPYQSKTLEVFVADKATQHSPSWWDQFTNYVTNLWNYYFTNHKPASDNAISAPSKIETLSADRLTTVTKSSIGTQTEDNAVENATKFSESFFKPKNPTIEDNIRNSLKPEVPYVPLNAVGVPVVQPEAPVYVDPSKEAMLPIPQSVDDMELAKVIQNSLKDLPERNQALYDEKGLLKQPIAKITDPNIKIPEWDSVSNPVNTVLSSTSGVEKASKGVYSEEFLKALAENPTKKELVALIDAKNPPVLPLEGTLVPLNAVGVPVAALGQAPAQNEVNPHGLEAYYDVE